jgi:hypothetical protein
MTSLLFDTSLPPEEQRPSKKKRARATAGPRHEVEELPKKPLIFRDIRPLGRIDDTYACADDACAALAHDILEDVGGRWVVECCFCAAKQEVPAVAGVIKEPEPDAFRFRDGRYAGQTLDEAAATPRGADYLAWAAESHPRPAVREAVKSWLANRSGGL